MLIIQKLQILQQTCFVCAPITEIIYTFPDGISVK